MISSKWTKITDRLINTKTKNINCQAITMYIANRRDCGIFKGCSPLQLHLGLIGLKPAIAYLPYTHRCTQATKNDTSC